MSVDASCPLLTQSGHHQTLLNWTSVQLAIFLSIDEDRKYGRPNVAVCQTCGGCVNGDDSVALQRCLEDQDENNRIRCIRACACIDVG